MLDLEASGFGRGSYPIEVGFVLPDGEAVCSLIRPPPHWTHWDPAAERVHGIAHERLLAQGRPVREVAELLNARLGGLTVYSDNWGFDYTWLGRLHDEAGIFPAYRLEHLRRLLSDAEAARWHEAKQQVEGRLKLRRHRASTDARLLQCTLAYLRGQHLGPDPLDGRLAATS